jgi:hypothetical protein
LRQRAGAVFSLAEPPKRRSDSVSLTEATMRVRRPAWVALVALVLYLGWLLPARGKLPAVSWLINTALVYSFVCLACGLRRVSRVAAVVGFVLALALWPLYFLLVPDPGYWWWADQPGYWLLVASAAVLAVGCPSGQNDSAQTALRPLPPELEAAARERFNPQRDSEAHDPRVQRRDAVRE